MTLDLDAQQDALDLSWGRRLLASGQADDALPLVDRVLARSPDSLAAWDLRARLALVLRDGAQAEATARVVLSLDPVSRDARLILTRALLLLHRPAEALQSAIACLLRAPDLMPRVWPLARQAAHQVQAEPGQASGDVLLRLAVQRLLLRYPDRVEGWSCLSDVETDWDRRRDALDRALALAPDNLPLAWSRCFASLSPAYADETALLAARTDFSTRLEALVPRVAAASTETMEELRQRAERDNPLLLAFQGENDRALMTRWGQLLTLIADRTLGPAPALSLGSSEDDPLSASASAGKRLSVGIVSALFHYHTIARLHLGWIRHLDRNALHVTCWQVGTLRDPMVEAAAAAADRFVSLPHDGRAARDAIAAAAPDILIYPEAEMDPVVRLLAAQRLAPLQAVSAFGHPVTTGLPTIDLFLSADAMEPPDADAHYTERLIRLPGFGLCVDPPAPPQFPGPDGRDRAAFGLPSDRPVIFAAQTCPKFLPRYDALLPSIVLLRPDVLFVLIDRGGSPVFWQRLRTAFSAAGLDPDHHMIRLPMVDSAGYAALNRACDLFLDIPGWSGGMTTLDALAAGLPIATWAGPLMRARHTAAILTTLGLPQLIAPSVGALPALVAIMLEDLPRWRAIFREALPNLFGNKSAAKALAKILQDEYTVRQIPP